MPRLAPDTVEESERDPMMGRESEERARRRGKKALCLLSMYSPSFDMAFAVVESREVWAALGVGVWGTTPPYLIYSEHRPRSHPTT